MDPTFYNLDNACNLIAQFNINRGDKLAVNTEGQLIINEGGFTQAITRTVKDYFYGGHNHIAVTKYFHGLLDGIETARLEPEDIKKMNSQLNLVRRTIKDISDTCASMELTETQTAYQAIYEKCVHLNPLQEEIIYSQETNRIVDHVKQIAEDSPLKQPVGLVTLLFSHSLILLTSIPFYLLNPIAALVCYVAKSHFGYTEEIISPSQWWQRACLQTFYPDRSIDELKRLTQEVELHDLFTELLNVPVIGEEQVRAFEEMAALNCKISPVITTNREFRYLELASSNIDVYLNDFHESLNLSEIRAEIISHEGARVALTQMLNEFPRPLKSRDFVTLVNRTKDYLRWIENPDLEWLEPTSEMLQKKQERDGVYKDETIGDMSKRFDRRDELSEELSTFFDLTYRKENVVKWISDFKGSTREDRIAYFLHNIPENVKPRGQYGAGTKLISPVHFRRIIEAAMANPSCNEIWAPLMLSNKESYFENSDFQQGESDHIYKRKISVLTENKDCSGLDPSYEHIIVVALATFCLPALLS